MDTINNITSAAGKALWGDGAKASGEEPVSGQKGAGTTDEPYDKGNAEGTRVSMSVMLLALCSLVSRYNRFIRQCRPIRKQPPYIRRRHLVRIAMALPMPPRIHPPETQSQLKAQSRSSKEPTVPKTPLDQKTQTPSKTVKIKPRLRLPKTGQRFPTPTRSEKRRWQRENSPMTLMTIRASL